MGFDLFDRWGRRRSGLIFSPVSVLYFMILLLGLLLLSPLLLATLRGVMIVGLGLPPELAMGFLLLSLFGSFFNVPLYEIVSREPILTFRRISFFGVTWNIPDVRIGTRKTLVTLNVGGALVPILISAYILGDLIPSREPSPLTTYLKFLIALVVVTLVVHRSSRPIRGLGIATPAFIPPMTTVLITLVLFPLGPVSNPFLIAYASGTLGTLLGADLLNFRRFADLGAPVVSIGGAGTFDGIYTTGLASVLLLLLLL